jgi:Isochorismatase family
MFVAAGRTGIMRSIASPSTRPSRRAIRSSPRRKTRVGAMSTTDLDRQLRDRGIDTLVLAGISTSGVVLSTVVEATGRD